VVRPLAWHRILPWGVRSSRPTQYPPPMKGAKLTDHERPHNNGDGLFRMAGQDERHLASDTTDVKPVTQPSRDLFHHAVNHEAAEHQRPNTRRDEATMRSLRFPFDEDDCQ
jgi:hypothetical protein